MKKAQTLLEDHNGKKKLNEGDFVMCMQANRDENGLMVNADWSFAKDATAQDIKSMLGGFLGNIEEVFGEKMVTEAVTHYAEDMGHMVNTPQGKAMYLRSKGLNFKDWKSGGDNDGKK